MDEILAIAKKHKLKVIEDAAQSPGTFYQNRAAGGLGDVGGFSLNFHKHIHTGEGGVLVTNDDFVAERCRLIRNHGENAASARGVEDLTNTLGGNYRLTELQAAIGREQLKKLPVYLAGRRRMAAHLYRHLSKYGELALPAPTHENSQAWYGFPFRLLEGESGLSRKAFVRAVNAEFPSPDDVENTPLLEAYVKPLYLLPHFQQQKGIGRGHFPFDLHPESSSLYPKGLCPVAERCYEREFVYCPLVREPLEVGVMDELAEAIDKVLESAEEIEALVCSDHDTSGPLTPLDAANSRKNLKDGPM